MPEGRSPEEKRIIRIAMENGQGHLFRFWDELSAPEKDELINDVKSIDFDRLREAVKLLKAQRKPKGHFTLPEIIRADIEESEPGLYQKARLMGENLIKDGGVAVFTAAGGQSTRLGLDIPKGCFPVTPIKRKTLFQVFAEKIIFMRERFRSVFPWIIMTSETNHQQTIDFFEQNNFFGLEAENVWFIIQEMFPSVDGEGRIFLREKNRIFKNPTGHGGTINALFSSGVLERLEKAGVESIFYFQVDNVLVKVLDPVYLGLHKLRGAEMSSKCVRKKDVNEKMGVFAGLDGRPVVVEYSEADLLDDPEKGYTRADFMYGNIAVHIIETAFVKRLVSNGIELPFHVAFKKIPHMDDNGNKINPTAPNGYKFETFIFDALAFAERSLVVETIRREEFSPLKNREGDDSPQTVERDQLLMFAGWFEEAGIPVERMDDGLPVYRLEVSPVFAPFKEYFLEKIDRNMRVEGDTYIE